MQETASTPQPPPASQASTAELVKQLSEQVSELVKDELKLARLEMTRKGKQAGMGAALFGSAGVLGLWGAACLTACAVIAIAGVVSPWLAALIVGAALVVVSAVMAMVASRRLRRATPPVPEEAVGSVKADIEEIREKAHR